MSPTVRWRQLLNSSIVKQWFLKQTFLKRGWLEIAHILSTCGPDLPRASRALRMDAPFRQRVTSEKSTVCMYNLVNFHNRTVVTFFGHAQVTISRINLQIEPVTF